MPLILQALPLSLKTFWRYLLVLPILGIIASLLLLATFIPLVGLIVPGTVYALCLMTGLRCALAARGHDTAPGFGHTLLAGVVFCLLTIVATFVIKLAVVLMPLLVAHSFGWLQGMVDNDPDLLAYGGRVSGLVTLFTMLWIAALAVPMTFAVAGTGWRGRGLKPFDGIGSGMISLTLISVVWMVGGSFFSIFDNGATIVALLSETIRAVVAAKDPAWDWSISPLSLLGEALWMAWTSSWFFSTAVLYWERAVDRRKVSAYATVQAARVSSEDLRALRLARMRGTDGPPS